MKKKYWLASLRISDNYYIKIATRKLMQVAHIKAIFFPNGENTLAPPKIGHVRLKDSRGKTQGIYDLKIRHTNEII